MYACIAWRGTAQQGIAGHGIALHNMHACMHGWMDGRTDGWMHKCTFINSLVFGFGSRGARLSVHLLPLSDVACES